VIALDRDVAVERLQLDDTSWVDVARGWLAGADDLYAALLEDVAWQGSTLYRYDHVIEENRLGSFWTRGRPLPHEALAVTTRALQARYKVMFEGFGMIQYRDGRDGQAFHRDTDMKWLDDTIVAILTLGARRPWLLRPKTARHTLADGKGATHDLCPGSGDLIVMGGKCQSDWEHSVPYLGRQHVGVRISIQWRHARRVGRPFQGGSYGAPLHYSGRSR
jgi:alkylated DNA repair dioxygenase AlkB